MIRKILALLLLVPFLATGAALAEQPARATAGAAAQVAADRQQTSPLPEPALCEALVVAPGRALAVPGATTPVEQAAACQACPIPTRTCNGYPYCYVGNDCCCPLKGICACVCW